MPAEEIQKVAPSGDIISLKHIRSARAGPWSEPDHLYSASCGCGYDLRAYGRGEGWEKVCPMHRGKFQIIEIPEENNILPYHCSVGEYLTDSKSPAFIAFLMGKSWCPSTYEYGTNAGDYTSELESTGTELWFHLVRQGENMRSIKIAAREVA